MKSKPGIAVAAIAASVMIAAFLAGCGGGGSGVRGEVTKVEVTSHWQDVSQGGLIVFGVRVEGTRLGQSVPLTASVFMADEYGERLEGEYGAAHYETTVIAPPALLRGTYDDVDYFYSLVELRPSSEEDTGHIVITISTAGRGAANLSGYMSVYLRPNSGQVEGVTLNNHAANTANAHRSSDPDRIVPVAFAPSVAWEQNPLPAEVPVGDRNNVVWQIMSGITGGAETSIHPANGTLIIPRQQMPGTLRIRATSRFDGKEYAERDFTVDVPVVNAIAVSIENYDTPMPRGTTRAITAIVSGIGYPQDLPRGPVAWSVEPSDARDTTIIPNPDNNLLATLSVSTWERMDGVRVRAQYMDTGLPYGVSDTLYIAGGPRIGAFLEVKAGDFHVLARDWYSGLWAWGRNDHGQLGIGSSGLPVNTPTQVGAHQDWIQISGGEFHSLGIRQGGTLWSWGRGDRGVLGLNTPNGNIFVETTGGTDANRVSAAHAPVSHNTPQRVGTASNWSYVSAGASWGIWGTSTTFAALSTALATNGTISTWGTNNNGQAGTGVNNTANTLWPFPRPANPPPPPGRQWRSVDTGRPASVAAISVDGFLYTWGHNANDLGRFDPDASVMTPTRVNHPVAGTRWLSVSAGLNFMVAVDANGEMWSWGSNNNARLGRPGHGFGEFDFLPGRVVFPANAGTVRFTDVSVSQGAQHVLAIDTQGRLWAWGHNSYGQIGNGAAPASGNDVGVMPVRITVPAGHAGTGSPAILYWRSANAGGQFSVAVSRHLNADHDGIIFTWGQNLFGQMGNPDSTNDYYNTPQRLDVGRGAHD